MTRWLGVWQASRMIPGSSGSRPLLHSKGERERTYWRKKLDNSWCSFSPLEYFRYLCSCLAYQHSGQVNSFLKILSPHSQNPGNKKLYPLLLVYATSAVTTTLPCLVYSLSLPSPSSSTSTPSDFTLTFEQRLILLSGYISFFLVPLTMLLDMASRVYKLVLQGLKTETEKWE